MRGFDAKRTCTYYTRSDDGNDHDDNDTGTDLMPILQMGELSLESSEVALLVSGRAGMKAACFQDRNPFLSDGQSPGMSLSVRVLKKNMS